MMDVQERPMQQERPRHPWQCGKCGHWIVVVDKGQTCPVCLRGLCIRNALEHSYLEEEGWKPTVWKNARNEEEQKPRVHWVGGVGEKRPRQKAGGDVVRFCCVSDMHNVHRQLAMPIEEDEVDVVLVTGDVSNRGSPWVIEDVDQWLGELPVSHRVLCGGNHDVTLHASFCRDQWPRFLEEEPSLPMTMRNAVVLQDSGVELMGIRIFGFPWVHRNHGWAWEVTEEEMKALATQRIPEGTDVLMTHNPSAGWKNRGFLNEHLDLGSVAIRDRCREIKPAVHVFGHVHGGYGIEKGSVPLVINASSVTSSYKPRAPLYFDLKK